MKYQDDHGTLPGPTTEYHKRQTSLQHNNAVLCELTVRERTGGGQLPDGNLEAVEKCILIASPVLGRDSDKTGTPLHQSAYHVPADQLVSRSRR